MSKSTKNLITEKIKQQVKALFDQGLGGRGIAKELGISRQFVKQIYKSLGLENVQRRNIILYDDLGNACKKCRKCGLVKVIGEFPITNKRTGLRDTRCHACTLEYAHNYYQDNKEDICNDLKEERKQNPDRRPSFEDVINATMIDKIKDMYNQGMGHWTISQKLDVSKTYVKRAFEMLGFKSGKKKVLTPELMQQVKELFDQEWGSRKIASHLNISRDFVQQIYKSLDVYNIGRTPPRYAYKQTEKKCGGKCQQVKTVDQFRRRIGVYADGSERISYEASCLDCVKEERDQNRPDGTRRFNNWNIVEQIQHIDDPVLYDRAYGALYNKERRKVDEMFKLRSYISTAICNSLRTNGGYKNSSIMKYLAYTIPELKAYLEAIFEPWMTWENYGMYDKETWDDNDILTWTWSLDHIIPQSDLPYASMEDDNFKKCWDLSNLRPLSAKINWLDGIYRTRHAINKTASI